MADDLTSAVPGADFPGGAPAAGGPARKKGFLSSTAGKIVLAGIALVVLGALIAAVALVLLGFFGANPVKDAIDQTLGGGAPPGVATTGTPTSVPSTRTAGAKGKSKEATKVPVAVANSEVFTFRDIFEKVGVESVPSATENGSDGTFHGEADTLYLLDIVTENGVRHAVLWWNGRSYTLSAGQTVTGTPWQVVEVREDAVTMLYGDSTVILRIGQGSIAAK